MNHKYSLEAVSSTIAQHTMLWEWAQKNLDWPSNLEKDCEKPNRYESLGRFIAAIPKYGPLDLTLCRETADAAEIRTRANRNYGNGMHEDAYNLAMLADYLEAHK